MAWWEVSCYLARFQNVTLNLSTPKTWTWSICIHIRPENTHHVCCHCKRFTPGMYAETRPLSYGRVKQNMDGCLFVWMGKKNVILSYHGLQYVGLLRALYTHVIDILHRHVCISWASTWHLASPRVLARFREGRAHVQRQAKFWSFINLWFNEDTHCELQ